MGYWYVGWHLYDNIDTELYIKRVRVLYFRSKRRIVWLFSLYDEEKATLYERLLYEVAERFLY